jgi:hypothetical protein
MRKCLHLGRKKDLGADSVERFQGIYFATGTALAVDLALLMTNQLLCMFHDQMTKRGVALVPTFSLVALC